MAISPERKKGIRLLSVEDGALLSAPIPPLPQDRVEEMENIAQIFRLPDARAAWERVIQNRRRDGLKDWRETGLPGDVFNIWTNTMMILGAKHPNCADLNPVRSFESYVEEKNGFDRAMCNYLLKKSNRTAVAALNTLGEAFNADLERIRRERDVDAAKSFARKAHEILRGFAAKF